MLQILCSEMRLFLQTVPSFQALANEVRNEGAVLQKRPHVGAKNLPHNREPDSVNYQYGKKALRTR